MRVFVLAVFCLLQFKNADSLKLSARCSFVSFNLELAARGRDSARPRAAFVAQLVL